MVAGRRRPRDPSAVAELPAGTVTFLFTDVEGSTRLLRGLGPEGYAEALAEHRRLVRAACARHGGVEVDTQGEEYGRTVLALARDMDDRRHAVQALGLLATLATGRGDAERAGRLWGAAEAQERLGPPGQRPRMAVWEQERERFAAVVLAKPTPELERALEGGRTLTLEEAVEYAVSGD